MPDQILKCLCEIAAHDQANLVVQSIRQQTRCDELNLHNIVLSYIEKDQSTEHTNKSFMKLNLCYSIASFIQPSAHWHKTRRTLHTSRTTCKVH